MNQSIKSMVVDSGLSAFQAAIAVSGRSIRWWAAVTLLEIAQCRKEGGGLANLRQIDEMSCQTGKVVGLSKCYQ